MSERLFDGRAQDDGYYLTVAVKGRTVGFVFISKPDNNGISTLETIAVDGDMRKEGVGSELMDLALGYAKESGAKSITGVFKPEIGYETQARRFYEKHGFAILEGDILSLNL